MRSSGVIGAHTLELRCVAILDPVVVQGFGIVLVLAAAQGVGAPSVGHAGTALWLAEAYTALHVSGE